MQAVRRPAIYFRLRTWWRSVDLATQLDAIGAAVVVLAYLFLGIFVPELFR